MSSQRFFLVIEKTIPEKSGAEAIRDVIPAVAT
jgi:hypothetical protein